MWVGGGGGGGGQVILTASSGEKRRESIPAVRLHAPSDKIMLAHVTAHSRKNQKVPIPTRVSLRVDAVVFI